jgi:hypothetical protein
MALRDFGVEALDLVSGGRPGAATGGRVDVGVIMGGAAEGNFLGFVGFPSAFILTVPPLVFSFLTFTELEGALATVIFDAEAFFFSGGGRALVTTLDVGTALIDGAGITPFGSSLPRFGPTDKLTRFFGFGGGLGLGLLTLRGIPVVDGAEESAGGDDITDVATKGGEDLTGGGGGDCTGLFLFIDNVSLSFGLATAVDSSVD